MDFRDYLRLAEDLANGTTEAEWRSATSRGYYAAFHVARLLLEDLRFTIPRDDKAHKFLYFRLNNGGDAQVANAAYHLNYLRNERNWCDYNLRVSCRQDVAVSHIQLAEDIIRMLDAARNEPTRTQITDAMKIYERDILKTVTWHP